MLKYSRENSREDGREDSREDSREDRREDSTVEKTEGNIIERTVQKNHGNRRTLKNNKSSS